MTWQWQVLTGFLQEAINSINVRIIVSGRAVISITTILLFSCVWSLRYFWTLCNSLTFLPNDDGRARIGDGLLLTVFSTQLTLVQLNGVFVTKI